MNNSLKDLHAQAMGEQSARFERSYLDCKDSSFSWWDNEAQQRKTSKDPIIGIIIGEAMKLEVYSTREEKFYRSNYYLNSRDVKLYSPDGKLVKQGSLKEISNYAIASLGSHPKKKKVLWIATEKGVVELRSNLVLAIDQLKPFSRDNKVSYTFKFTPHLYEPTDIDVSNSTKEILGKIAAKQPPTFVKINKHEQITNLIEDRYQLEEKLTSFIDWRNHHTSNSEIEKNAASVLPDPNSLDDIFNKPPKVQII